MSTRAMIFDFDGTIANTFDAVVNTLNALADEFGYRRAPPEELPELTAMNPRQIVERVGLPWHKLPILVARVRKDMARNMPDVQPCAGVPAALAGLRERGVRLGMLTSNNRENVDAFLARQSALSFEFISTGSSLFGKQRKLAALLRKQGLDASEVAYVGDEVRDIEAARAVGVKMIAVTWGFSQPQLLAASKPDHLISDPAELLTLV